MSGNAIYRRLHCVVFSPVHPKAVRAKGPAQTLDSPYSKRRSSGVVQWFMLLSVQIFDTICLTYPCASMQKRSHSSMLL